MSLNLLNAMVAANKKPGSKVVAHPHSKAPGPAKAKGWLDPTPLPEKPAKGKKDTTYEYGRKPLTMEEGHRTRRFGIERVLWQSQTSFKLQEVAEVSFTPSQDEICGLVLVDRVYNNRRDFVLAVAVHEEAEDGQLTPCGYRPLNPSTEKKILNNFSWSNNCLFTNAKHTIERIKAYGNRTPIVSPLTEYAELFRDVGFVSDRTAAGWCDLGREDTPFQAQSALLFKEKGPYIPKPLIGLFPDIAEQLGHEDLVGEEEEPEALEEEEEAAAAADAAEAGDEDAVADDEFPSEEDEEQQEEEGVEDEAVPRRQSSRPRKPAQNPDYASDDHGDDPEAVATYLEGDYQAEEMQEKSASNNDDEHEISQAPEEEAMVVAAKTDWEKPLQAIRISPEKYLETNTIIRNADLAYPAMPEADAGISFSGKKPAVSVAEPAKPAAKKPVPPPAPAAAVPAKKPAPPQKKPPPPAAKPSPAPVANKPEMPTTKNVVPESGKPKKQAVPKQAPKQPSVDAEANKRKTTSESSQPVKKIKTVNAAPPSSPAAKPKAVKPASTAPAETVYPNVELLERFNKRLETAKSETVAQYAKPELFTARLNTQITPRQLLTLSADHAHCQVLLPILYELWAHELGLPLNVEEPGELLSYDSAAAVQLWVGLDTSMRCYDAVRWCVENANFWSGKKYSVPFVSSTLVRFNVDNMEEYKQSLMPVPVLKELYSLYLAFQALHVQAPADEDAPPDEPEQISDW